MKFWAFSNNTDTINRNLKIFSTEFSSLVTWYFSLMEQVLYFPKKIFHNFQFCFFVHTLFYKQRSN